MRAHHTNIITRWLYTSNVPKILFSGLGLNKRMIQLMGSLYLWIYIVMFRKYTEIKPTNNIIIQTLSSEEAKKQDSLGQDTYNL